MKNCPAPENHATRCILLFACATVLTVAFTVSLPQPVHAAHVTPPPVPENIEVEAGNRAFLVGHAVGTQNYICLPSGSGFAWTLFTPQATLFRDNQRQVITHYFSPNLSPIPRDEAPGTVRATWQDSRDTSTVWAKLDQSSSDSDFVASGAIPWLLLKVVGAQDGPKGGHELTATTFIQRLNTSGGVAPSTGCAASTDVGREAFMPYTADYFFYKKAADSNGHDGHDDDH